MRWAGHVECLAERRVACMVLVGKAEVHRPLGKLDVDGKTIIKRTCKKYNGGHSLD
jgi:hypothetical protein